MTQAQIYSLVTSLLFGVQMDNAMFLSFLDMAQDQVEGMRPWMILRAEDSSLSAGNGNTFLTPFALAPVNTDFKKWYGDAPVQLVDANNNAVKFSEVPIAQKFTCKSITGKFYCDYAGKNLYLCGNLTQSYTIHQFYIKNSTRISLNANNVWVFDSYGYSFSALLAFLIAMMYKGVDYDLVALQNAGQLGTQAQSVLNAMTRWDDDLQRSGTVGFDPFHDDEGGWQGNSGGGRMG